MDCISTKSTWPLQLKSFLSNGFTTSPVHELCSKACTPENVTYNLCSNDKNITSERRNASESMKRQATRMRNMSERILSDVDIGTNVLIPISVAAGLFGRTTTTSCEALSIT
jgi:hypothetical protein